MRSSLARAAPPGGRLAIDVRREANILFVALCLVRDGSRWGDWPDYLSACRQPRRFRGRRPRPPLRHTDVRMMPGPCLTVWTGSHRRMGPGRVWRPSCRSSAISSTPTAVGWCTGAACVRAYFWSTVDSLLLTACVGAYFWSTVHSTYSSPVTMSSRLTAPTHSLRCAARSTPCPQDTHAHHDTHCLF